MNSLIALLKKIQYCFYFFFSKNHILVIRNKKDNIIYCSAKTIVDFAELVKLVDQAVEDGEKHFEFKETDQ